VAVTLLLGIGGALVGGVGNRRDALGPGAKAFCVDCGSHTHTISPDDPTLVAIRLGCLDQVPGIRPQAHQFVAYASSLEPLPDDGLPRFPERLGATEPL